LKAVCLISGGIDSPVAAYLMAMRGAEMMLLHMDNRPYSDDTGIEKVQDLRDRLELVTGREIRLFVAPHGRNQEIISASCRKGFQCVLCKRTMLRAACLFAKKYCAEAIVTGDSLGQVASQTVQNIRAESLGIEMPILRPLIGLDKIEIEAIAKRIRTFDISTRTPSACTIVPKRPVTMARLDMVFDELKRIDHDEMTAYAADRAEEIIRRR
jgi:thiamine biosynthesis protein ThiI